MKQNLKVGNKMLFNWNNFLANYLPVQSILGKNQAFYFFQIFRSLNALLSIEI